MKNEVAGLANSQAENESVTASHSGHLLPSRMEEMRLDDVLSSRAQDFSKTDPLTNMVCGKVLAEEPEKSEERGDKQTSVSQQKETSEKPSSKMRNEVEVLQNGQQELGEEAILEGSKSGNLEEEFELLKAAAEMAFDDSNPIEFHLERLGGEIDARKCNLVEMESQWDALRNSLEEKKRSLEESLYGDHPEAQEKLEKLREVRLERNSVLSEIQKREDEYSKLSEDLKKQPKGESRRSYIERIKEITKNSRKQDVDIERILKETRELQLESNSIQERLHRTYAIVDEMIFREAKKDSVGRQAYRLLTSMHESFEQVSEKILATDRLQREVAEYEKKLAAMASRSLNVDKIQSDLDAISKENEYLENALKG